MSPISAKRARRLDRRSAARNRRRPDAATHDRQVEKAHRAFVDRFVRGTAKRIRADIDRGLIEPLDAEETARVDLMSESFLNEKLGREPQGEWRRTVDALTTLWQRALYGETR
jgi:hypothetical protein